MNSSKSKSRRRKTHKKSEEQKKPGDQTILPFSVHDLRWEGRTAFIKRAYVAGRVIYPTGGSVRYHRQRERALKRAARQVIAEIGVPDGKPEVALVVLVPNDLGHLNLDAAERITVPAVEGERQGHIRVLVAVGKALSQSDSGRLARRLKVERDRLLSVSDDYPSIVDVAASLLANTWRAAA